MRTNITTFSTQLNNVMTSLDSTYVAGQNAGVIKVSDIGVGMAGPTRYNKLGSFNPMPGKKSEFVWKIYNPGGNAAVVNSISGIYLQSQPRSKVDLNTDLDNGRIVIRRIDMMGLVAGKSDWSTYGNSGAQIKQHPSVSNAKLQWKVLPSKGNWAHVGLREARKPGVGITSTIPTQAEFKNDGLTHSSPGLDDFTRHDGVTTAANFKRVQ